MFGFLLSKLNRFSLLVFIIYLFTHPPFWIQPKMGVEIALMSLRIAMVGKKTPNAWLPILL